MPETQILIAPNAFKSAASAFEIAQAIKDGLLKSNCACNAVCHPIADGGDGTLPIIVEALEGKIFQKEVAGPLGKKVTAPFGYVAAKQLAVIEMADASGLRLLSTTERHALKASSFGTGQLMKQAIEAGARQIILCIGGSASTDGGMGILAALGYTFLDANGQELPSSGESLALINKVIEPDSAIAIQVTVLCDVNNPLLGPSGAAAIYGPQKGASPPDVKLLEDGLVNWASLIKRYKEVDVTSIKGGGAAGGVSAGLVGWLGAELQPGAHFVLELLEMEKAIRKSDLVITAEGSLDEQTSEGKGPFALLEMAESLGKPVIGLAGCIPRHIPANELKRFQALFPIGNQPEKLEDAIANTLVNIERTAFNIGNILAAAALKV